MPDFKGETCNIKFRKEKKFVRKEKIKLLILKLNETKD
jgi:hypothetical protein